MADGRQRRALHALLDFAAFRVELIETRGQRQRFAVVVGQQAADADRHVVEPARGIEARTDGEAEIGAR